MQQGMNNLVVHHHLNFTATVRPCLNVLEGSCSFGNVEYNIYDDCSVRWIYAFTEVETCNLCGEPCMILR